MEKKICRVQINVLWWNCHCQNVNEAISLANDWENEHIQIATENVWNAAKQINGAFEIQLSQHTTFSAICYAIGIPVCFPTGQFSKIYPEITLEAFLKVSAITELSKIGLQPLVDSIKVLFEYEGFPGHTNSIVIIQETNTI